MIEKMNFLSITGPRNDIDRVLDVYLSHFEIHLENALAELKTVKGLSPFIEVNPYKDILNSSLSFDSLLKDNSIPVDETMTRDDALAIIKEATAAADKLNIMLDDLTLKREKALDLLEKIENFRRLDYNIGEILHFKFIKYRFGKIETEYYDKFTSYIYNNLDTVFYECFKTKDYVWGIYFVPRTLCSKVDAIYSSMHFDRIFIPDEYDGTATEAYDKLESEIHKFDREIDDTKAKISDIITANKPKLKSAYNKIKTLSDNFDIRKLAACTKEKDDTFYILCGWMTSKDAAAFSKAIENDSNVFCISEPDHNNIYSSPPTKLKNPILAKPFEMYTRMYGLPAYNEMDPTMFIAITYAFIFGCMYGDVGQGLCLLIGGFLLYKIKHINLAGIISAAGFFSTIFGFMFGSVFGFEDIIEAVWIHPRTTMMNLPFLGRMNSILVISIAFGTLLVVLTMIFNIINSLRQRDKGNALFDKNGVAGLIFYLSLIVCAALFLTGNQLPATIILLIFFIIPLILIAFKEPLSALLEKKKDLFPEGKIMFVVQSFFELFEVLLSYFSNTISFVRIGAFAISHAAMMEVVLMLAGAENGGSPNYIIIILGNIFVMGLEGLIVGIQVLRLEYYEFFSRFYKGDGREFRPFKKQNAKN